MAYDDSACKNNIYCNFETTLDNAEVQKEACINCGKIVMYNKVRGRVDNAKYLRDHIRTTVQPYGRTGKLFRQIYGIETVELLRKNAEAKSKSMSESWDELRVKIQNQQKGRIYFT